MLPVLAGIVGVLVVGVTLWDVFETMVLSRRVLGTFRPTRLFYRLSWEAWAKLGGLAKEAHRETILGLYGPLFLLMLLAAWAAALIFGFAMLQLAFGSDLMVSDGNASFSEDLFFSGTTFTTLGLGDVSPDDGAARILTVIEAVTGFAFLALVIGYLPALYQSFSRREVVISLLDARAGSPPSAAELLRRQAAGDGEAEYLLLAEWERWAAELLETHISFPILAYFRSQHEQQSWLATLTTILDVSALVSTCNPGKARGQAELTFAMARHAAVDLSQVFSSSPRPMTTERLSEAELPQLRTLLAKAGLHRSTTEEADLKLKELRALYEPFVYSLSELLLMPLPSWVPAPDARDDWRKSAWD
jgi:Ion channel